MDGMWLRGPYPGNGVEVLGWLWDMNSGGEQPCRGGLSVVMALQGGSTLRMSRPQVAMSMFI